jgi:hypothetical protein
MKNQSTKEKEKLYSWYPSESAPYLYPTTIHIGYFGMNDKSTVYIPSKSIVGNTWGLGQSLHIVGEEYKPLPEAIEIVWLSFTENKFYFVSDWLPKNKLQTLFDTVWMNAQGAERQYNRLVVGMAPYGMIQIWAAGDGRTTEVCCLHGPEVSVKMSEFRPHAIMSQEEYIKKIQKYPRVSENLKKNGLPDSLLFENYRKRFNYHIVPNVEMDSVNIDNITVRYFNGEYDEILWERLKENPYTLQARPRKIDVHWKAGKDRYLARFKFDEEMILSIFEGVFGENYPQNDNFASTEAFEKIYANGILPKGEFVIKIDKYGKSFKLTLKIDNKERVISTDKIQTIVFKNDKFIYVSNNYNKRDWLYD